MKDYLIFAGLSSKDYGVYVADCLDKFTAPRKRVDKVEVPGRDGSLTISDGTYEDVTVRYRLYARKSIYDSIGKNVLAFRNALNSVAGHQRLEDTFMKNEFRLAQYASLFEVDSSDRKNAAFEIEFDCQPQRFLKAGEIMAEISSSTTLRNQHPTVAKPLVRVYGTGTVTIGDIPIVIRSASTYTDIDCDTQEAYKGSTNCNGNITLTDGKFWELKPGNNDIALSGVNKIEITPRWWIL